MQTLGLSEDRRKSDGRLKSLFWPTVENAWDVDYLGQQGFWICLVIGLISFALTLIVVSETFATASRIVELSVGAAVFFVYWVGGMGVRERSFAAALIVFATHVFDQLASGRVGVPALMIDGVLLSNLRATYLASRWKPVAGGEDTPTRFNETFRDKLVDQLPQKLWPVLKFPFFIASAVVLLMTIYGSVVSIRYRHASSPVDENSTPSTVVVAPPDLH